MSVNLQLPGGYRPILDVFEMEAAIKRVKDFFERNLAESLNLVRVTAPLFVRSATGLNDDLNGVEQPVRFTVSGDNGAEVEVVQSLAKWKRLALGRYGFARGQGLYTDMNAIRPDDVLDNLHSVYVDQWDWETVIGEDERHLETLTDAVRRIYDVIRRTEFHVASLYSAVRPVLPEEITFVTSEELVARYPGLSATERERKLVDEHGAVFLVGIGGEVAGGPPHDGRAPDYDDWSSHRSDGGCGLNGDILVRHPVLECPFELSSMGIRVDAESLRRQLRLRGCEDRATLPFHRALLDGELPQTMGGGIGQSRLCMFFLRAAHIGEVAVGIWPPEMEAACAGANIFLL
jgi:aspartate--ammonia ligase